MSWYNRKREEAEHNIQRWTRRYGDVDKVRFLVNNALLDTRSPGKKEVYTEWLKSSKI